MHAVASTNALRVAPVTLSGVPFIDFDQLEAPKELARRRERATLEKIAETAEEKEKEKADRLEQLAREEQEAEAEARARKEAIAEAKAHANEAKALAEAEALAELEKLEREEAEAEAEAQRRRDAIAAEKDRAEAEAKAELERLAREEQEAIAEAKRRAEAEALASVASVPPDVDVAPTPMMLRRNAKIGLARLKRLEEEDEQTPEPEDDDAGEEVEKSEVALSEAVQKKELATERGVPFSSEGAFYRAESAQARDEWVAAIGRATEKPQAVETGPSPSEQPSSKPPWQLLKLATHTHRAGWGLAVCLLAVVLTLSAVTQAGRMVVAEGGGEFITYQDMLDKYSTRVSSLADIAQRRSSSGVCDALQNLLPCVPGACVRMYKHLVRILYRYLAESV